MLPSEVPSPSVRRRLLREFLIAKRAAISPEAAGLPRRARRRTPGLRREEVAVLASVGVTWYTWLEQGRGIQVSADTLNRIARALRLTASDRAYLFALAEVSHQDLEQREETLDENMQAALDGFQAGPAMITGPFFDVEAFNSVADRIFRFADCDGPFARNHVWRFFMDPVRRSLYAEWSSVSVLCGSFLD